jgi:hypothetical protein
MTTVVIASRRPAVRAPFRVLAAIICLLLLGIAAGMVFTVWKSGVHALRVQDVMLVPGGLSFGRLTFYAAVRATVPPQDHWPFATPGVARAYWLIFICLSVAAS